MAINQTMSNPNDPWSMQMYQTNFSNIPQSEAPPTTITTTTGAAAGSSRNNRLSPDQGRVARPIRRRSRASRRTPTTLLNTDTTNFRAMVQQFTGGPSARSQLPGGGAAAFSFSVAGGGNSGMAAPQASGFQVLYPNNMQLMQQQQQQMFMMNNMHAGGGGGGGGGGVPNSQPPVGSSPASGNQNYDNFKL